MAEQQSTKVFVSSRSRSVAVFVIVVLVGMFHQSSHLQNYVMIENIATDHSQSIGIFEKHHHQQHNNAIVSMVGEYGHTGKAKRKWAIAFLIGGCGETRPQYRGFLYNVLVVAHILKELGSKADVVLMVQMSIHTNYTTLPDYELRILDAMGVRVHFVPKMAAPIHEVFYSLVKEKFRILDLTEYSRVLFLDADIMPLCNLDYLFELSEPKSGAPILKENIVLSWRKEPANAGFFMMRPDRDDYRLIEEVIRTKEEKALHMRYPYWDEVEGWGHTIEAPDYWRSEAGRTGTNWTWYGVYADQGLLYYWTKYVKQSVSLIIRDQVENWGSRDGRAYLENTREGLLANFSCAWSGKNWRPPPYRDFVHFTGKSKPWQSERHRLFRAWQRNHTEAPPVDGRFLKWFIALDAVENFTNTSFDFSFGNKKPPVGSFPTYAQMIAHIKARANTNWTHYQS